MRKDNNCAKVIETIVNALVDYGEHSVEDHRKDKPSHISDDDWVLYLALSLFCNMHKEVVPSQESVTVVETVLAQRGYKYDTHTLLTCAQQIALNNLTGGIGGIGGITAFELGIIGNPPATGKEKLN